MMSKAILVTGGAGFIGANFVPKNILIIKLLIWIS